MRVLAGIPCHNEEVAIGSAVLRAKPFVDEVLVVDDGSSDRSADVARAAGATVITHEANRGYGGAYRTLWDYARAKGFDALVTFDGDGQHDPEDIPALLAKLREGDDYVIGARWGEKTQMPVWRRVGKRVLDYGTAMASSTKAASGPRLTDSQSGFKAYSRRTLEAIYPPGEGMSVTSLLLVQASEQGLRIGETRIHCRYDVDGSSQGPVRHAAGVVNDIVIAVGVRHPMIYLGIPGLVALLGSLATGAWATIEVNQTDIVPVGWLLATLFLAMVGVSGIFAALLFNVLPRLLANTFARHGPKGGA